MAINDPTTVREPSAERVQRLSLRLLLVAAAGLVVGVGCLLWASWETSGGTPGFDPGATDSPAPTLAERALIMTLFSGVGPLLLLLATMLLCSALVIVRRPWDTIGLPPSRGLGLQPEIVGLTATASLLAVVQLMAALLALTVKGPTADAAGSGTLVASLSADAATLCLAAILTAHWWASDARPSNTEPA